MKVSKLDDRQYVVYMNCLNIIFDEIKLRDNSIGLRDYLDYAHKLDVLDESDFYVLDALIVSTDDNHNIKYHKLIHFLDHPEERFYYVRYVR